MPEMTTAVILIGSGSALFGAIIGWFLCARRAEQKRIALNAEWNEQLAALQKSEKRTNSERKHLAAELAAVRTKLNELTRTGKALEDTQSTSAAKMAEIEEELRESHARRDSLRANLNALIERTRTVAKTMAEKDEKIFSLSRELESWQQRLPPLVDKYREKDFQHTVVLEQLEAERTMNAELSNTMKTRIMPAHLAEEAMASSSPRGQTNGEPALDDLKRIRGVGPVLERTLNALGIHSLTQIANFSPDDVERISAQLPQFPGRIERDRWIEQARSLLQ
ncbi:MAG: hypothetical protein AAFZ58_13795 [Pseudomonadota bacterium]